MVPVTIIRYGGRLQWTLSTGQLGRGVFLLEGRDLRIDAYLPTGKRNFETSPYDQRITYLDLTTPNLYSVYSGLMYHINAERTNSDREVSNYRISYKRIYYFNINLFVIICS